MALAVLSKLVASLKGASPRATLSTVLAPQK
jgi:hypothetical protein